jgi:hypothetical protein
MCRISVAGGSGMAEQSDCATVSWHVIPSVDALSRYFVNDDRQRDTGACAGLIHHQEIRKSFPR